jgi:hypothetical protein
MIAYNDEVIKLRIVRGNRSTRRGTIPFPFCPPQIPRDMTEINPGRIDGKPATTHLSCGVA